MIKFGPRIYSCGSKVFRINRKKKEGKIKHSNKRRTHQDKDQTIYSIEPGVYKISNLPVFIMDGPTSKLLKILLNQPSLSRPCLPIDEIIIPGKLASINNLQFEEDMKLLPPFPEVSNDYTISNVGIPQPCLTNFYEGTVVKWCFAFKTSLAYESLGCPHDSASIKKGWHHSHDIRSSQLLVGSHFLYLTNSDNISRIDIPIIDCTVFQDLTYPALKMDHTDILLILQADGVLLSIIPPTHGNLPRTLNSNIFQVKKNGANQKRKVGFNPYKEVPKINSIIGQSFTLGYGDNWRIIKNPSNNKDFIVADFANGVMKFFTFTDRSKFEHQETIKFDNSKILSCYFLPSFENEVFISLSKANRIQYYLIEWVSQNPQKQVYKINHLSNDVVKDSFPIGANNILLNFNKKCLVISTKQIISGDTNYIEFPNRVIRGVKSWYFDDILSKKLVKIINSRNLSSEEINESNESTIVLTSSGVIYILFLIDSSKRLQIFSLGRFKGLRSIHPDTSTNNTEISHAFIALIFNRTVRLKLDLTKVQHITPTSHRLPNRIPVENKVTISSNSDQNNHTLIPVGGRHGIWIAGTSSISQLTKSSIVPIRKTKCVGKLFKRFANYSTIHMVKLLDEDTLEVYQVLCGTNEWDKSVTRYFFDIKKATFGDHPGLMEKYKSFQFESVIYPMKCEQIAIQSTSIIYKKIGNEATEFHSPHKIDGYYLYEQHLITWNHREKFLFYWHFNENGSGKPTPIPINCFSKYINPYFSYSFAMYDPSDENDKGIKVVLVLREKIIIKNLEDCLIDNDVEKETEPIVYSIESKNFSILPNGIFCFYILTNSLLTSIVYGKNLHTNNPKFFDFEPLQFDRTKQNYKIKAFNQENKIVVFSDDSLYLIYQSGTNVHTEEVKLPQNIGHRPHFLMDVTLFEEDEKELIGLLFDDGLQFIERTYLTWNKTDYLLQNTRTKQKKFLYLDNLKRLLVLNNDNNDWYLLNLGTGKVKTLDSNCLKIPGEKIQHIFEIPKANHDNVDDDKNCHRILVVFSSIVKYIKLEVILQNIKVTECDLLKLNDIIFPEVSSHKDSVTVMTRDGKIDTFHTLKIKSEKIEITKEFSIVAMSTTKYFIMGDDSIIMYGESLTVRDTPTYFLVAITQLHKIQGGLMTQKHLDNHVYRHKDIPHPVKRMIQIKERVIALVYDLSFSYTTTSSIEIVNTITGFNKKVFTEENNYDIPPEELDFYYYLNIYYPEDDNYDMRDVKPFDFSHIKEIKFQEAIKLSEFLDFPVIRLNEVDYTRANIEKKAEEIRFRELVSDNQLGSNYDKFVQLFKKLGYTSLKFPKIDLDKRIIDICYMNNSLYVLCHDQTVLQFGPTEDFFDRRRGMNNNMISPQSLQQIRNNYGYVIPSRNLAKKEETSEYMSIDRYGKCLMDKDS